MQKKWIHFLIDPLTNEPLELKINSSRGGKIIRGRLIFQKHTYPIIDGIPRFVPKRFYDESRTAASGATKTGKSFGDKWREKTYRVWGLDDKAEFKLLKEQLLATLGVKKATELNKLFKDNMNCLNVGCGVAWSEYLFNRNKKVNRFAVDLSLSVETAYKLTKNISNVFIAQADLLRLPFRKNFFDIIFSIGVLHHTGDAKKAFQALCNHLKPGGLIGIYIYCKKPFLRELADEKIREISTEMTFAQCLKFSEQMTKLGKSLQKLKQPLIIDCDIPLLEIKKGRYNLQKFIYDHFLKCFYNKSLGFDSSTLINLDWYHPKYVSHHAREEIKSWFKNNNLYNIQFIQPKGWKYAGYFVSGRKKNKQV
ncbi:methyltransferase domain-containing protein [Patescibacteria group bacterium AH-259-L05]|nr:methyltransferase domain-containing protein [Patescibacteria group bacterium AH-259-L05]